MAAILDFGYHTGFEAKSRVASKIICGGPLTKLQDQGLKIQNPSRNFVFLRADYNSHNIKRRVTVCIFVQQDHTALNESEFDLESCLLIKYQKVKLYIHHKYS
jgi:hypothetical protein